MAKITKTEFSWAIYDWANSAFATVIIAGLFPLFFKEYWASAITAAQSTFWLGFANSVSAFLIFVSAPLLGVMTDIRFSSKRFLMIFACVGIVSTVLLGFVGYGLWHTAIILYIFGLLGFSGANIFYDALLKRTIPTAQIHRASSLGFSLGYAGGGLLLLIIVILIQRPELVGLSATEVIQRSFVGTGLWWLLFSIPLILWVKTKRESRAVHTGEPLIRSSFRMLRSTAKEIIKSKQIFYFLLAYWFYIDGIDTVIRMAVDYGTSIGFESSTLIGALLLVQAISFPSTLLYYRLGIKIGVKRAILIGIVGYFIITLIGALMTKSIHFYLLAALVGLFQGGIQALSRSMFSHLIPDGKAGQYFGFYNMLGKFAAILGPLLLGITVLLTNNYRIGIIPITLLFVFGFIFMTKVRVTKDASSTPSTTDTS